MGRNISAQRATKSFKRFWPNGKRNKMQPKEQGRTTMMMTTIQSRRQRGGRQMAKKAVNSRTRRANTNKNKNNHRRDQKMRVDLIADRRVNPMNPPTLEDDESKIDQ